MDKFNDNVVKILAALFWACAATIVVAITIRIVMMIFGIR